MKKGIGFIILSIFIMLVAASVTVYAWFGLIEKTQPIIIYSGTVELEALLYDSNEDQITEAITITNVVPGDEYEYTLIIRNLGTIPSKLTVDFSFLTENPNLKDYITFNLNEDSKDFNNSNYLYEYSGLVINYNPETSANEIIINFSIKFNEAIEFSHLENQNNITQITKIEITLQQAV